MTKCETCSIIPKTEDDKFYDIRLTKTGKWSDGYVEHEDLVVCQGCFRGWVVANLDYLQSVRRIENPLISHKEVLK